MEISSRAVACKIFEKTKYNFSNDDFFEELCSIQEEETLFGDAKNVLTDIKILRKTYYGFLELWKNAPLTLPPE
jgi:hypothetical protein